MKIPFLISIGALIMYLPPPTAHVYLIHRQEKVSDHVHAVYIMSTCICLTRSSTLTVRDPLHCYCIQYGQSILTSQWLKSPILMIMGSHPCPLFIRLNIHIGNLQKRFTKCQHWYTYTCIYVWHTTKRSIFLIKPHSTVHVQHLDGEDLYCMRSNLYVTIQHSIASNNSILSSVHRS